MYLELYIRARFLKFSLVTSQLRIQCPCEIQYRWDPYEMLKFLRNSLRFTRQWLCVYLQYCRTYLNILKGFLLVDWESWNWCRQRIAWPVIRCSKGEPPPFDEEGMRMFRFHEQRGWLQDLFFFRICDTRVAIHDVLVRPSPSSLEFKTSWSNGRSLYSIGIF